MHIDAHFFRDFEELKWQYFPISNDHKIVTLECFDLTEKYFISTYFSRLKEGNSFFEGNDLYWTWSELTRPTYRFIGIGDDKNNLDFTRGK